MAEPKRGCKTCVWRLVNSGGDKGGYHCGYSLCLTHHSRVWLHHQRIGRESLDGMTFDTNCTEWMPGNPADKLSLLQDNPAQVAEKAWALLDRERGIVREKPEKPEKAKKQKVGIVPLNMDAARKLKSRCTWKQMADVTGYTTTGVEYAWRRGRIREDAARKIEAAFGVVIANCPVCGAKMDGGADYEA